MHKSAEFLNFNARLARLAVWTLLWVAGWLTILMKELLQQRCPTATV
jgi:hypothetical protein